MNQINGYCQIELPKRIRLGALTSTHITLTDVEAKPIIKALNLDQVLSGDASNASYINEWLNKPVIVKAYVPSEYGDEDVEAIFHASIVSLMFLNECLYIQFIYSDGGGGLYYVQINISIASEQSGTYMKWEIKVFAKQITTTTIS